jgi:hypothetical protein
MNEPIDAPCLRKVFAAQLMRADAVDVDPSADTLRLAGRAASHLQVQGVIVSAPAAVRAADCVYMLDDGTGCVPLRLAADMFDEGREGGPSDEALAAHGRLRLGALVSVWGAPVPVARPHGDASGDVSMAGAVEHATCGVEVRAATSVRTPAGCTALTAAAAGEPQGISPGAVASSAGSGTARPAVTDAPDACTVWALDVLHLWGGVYYS